MVHVQRPPYAPQQTLDVEYRHFAARYTRSPSVSVSLSLSVLSPVSLALSFSPCVYVCVFAVFMTRNHVEKRMQKQCKQYGTWEGKKRRLTQKD